MHWRSISILVSHLKGYSVLGHRRGGKDAENFKGVLIHEGTRSQDCGLHAPAHWRLAQTSGGTCVRSNGVTTRGEHVDGDYNPFEGFGFDETPGRPPRP